MRKQTLGQILDGQPICSVYKGYVFLVFAVDWWLATCTRKPKVPGSSPAASYVQR